MIHTFRKASLFLLLLSPLQGWAQEHEKVTIEECYIWALKHSTLAKRNEISHNISKAEIKESASDYLPSAAVNGQLSYQSEVVTIPLPSLDPLKKEQYRITLDVEQLIWDGGISSTTREISTSILDTELKRGEIDELTLRDRVSALFLAAVLLKDNREVATIHIEIIERNIKMLKSMRKDGIASLGSVIKLESEKLMAEQYMLEILYNRSKIMKALSITTGKELSLEMEFVLPTEVYIERAESIRPEYQLFDMQRKVLDGRMELLKSYNRPKMSAFVSGGIGLPGLDMLRSSAGWYYIAGVKLSVPLTAFKSTRHKKSQFISNKRLIDTQQIDFTRKNDIEIAYSKEEIAKCEAIILVDALIIKKRKEIVDIEELRLKNGIATTTDYITELNHYKEAMLVSGLNKIKLVQAIIDYKSNIGEI